MKIKKNGTVINLTESDLRRIVKRMINESSKFITIDEMIEYLKQEYGANSEGAMGKIYVEIPKRKTPFHSTDKFIFSKPNDKVVCERDWANDLEISTKNLTFDNFKSWVEECLSINPL
jgi:DNA replication initiation complex subunit (GINS family)